MRYGLVFLLCGVYLGVTAWSVRGLGWWLLWPAVSFFLVGGAYAGLGPRIFGKRANGTLAWWATFSLLPYLALNWLVWYLTRFTREACWNQVAAGLYLGRRAYSWELPTDVGLIVDLTAEFPEPAAVRRRRTYLSLPTLDDCPPDENAFRELVAKIVAYPASAYVHCALGHGRSATVMAAVLLAKGYVADIDAAEWLLRQARPGIRLKARQKRLAARVGKR
jgi:hypothetical protein